MNRKKQFRLVLVVVMITATLSGCSGNGFKEYASEITELSTAAATTSNDFITASSNLNIDDVASVETFVEAVENYKQYFVDVAAIDAPEELKEEHAKLKTSSDNLASLFDQLIAFAEGDTSLDVVTVSDDISLEATTFMEIIMAMETIIQE